MMERYTSNLNKRPAPLQQQTYAQVAHPRAQRSNSVKTVTAWPEVPEAERFVDPPPYTHPYDKGKSSNQPDCEFATDGQQVYLISQRCLQQLRRCQPIHRAICRLSANCHK